MKLLFKMKILCLWRVLMKSKQKIFYHLNLMDLQNFWKIILLLKQHSFHLQAQTHIIIRFRNSSHLKLLIKDYQSKLIKHKLWFQWSQI